jgi:hypothetical protein
MKTTMKKNPSIFQNIFYFFKVPTMDQEINTARDLINLNLNEKAKKIHFPFFFKFLFLSK